VAFSARALGEIGNRDRRLLPTAGAVVNPANPPFRFGREIVARKAANDLVVQLDRFLVATGGILDTSDCVDRIRNLGVARIRVRNLECPQCGGIAIAVP
jgi:hypothetical protein